MIINNIHWESANMRCGDFSKSVIFRTAKIKFKKKRQGKRITKKHINLANF